jgi:hypothetical protein
VAYACREVRQGHDATVDDRHARNAGRAERKTVHGIEVRNGLDLIFPDAVLAASSSDKKKLSHG